MATSNPLSAARAERLRIVAEHKLWRESRYTNRNLRRLVGHVALLESLDSLQQASPLSHSEPASSTCVASQTLTSIDVNDDIPGLEEAEDSSADADSDEEWSDEDEAALDGEDDAEHTLVRTSSHPSIFPEDWPRSIPTLLTSCNPLHSLRCVEWASEEAAAAKRADMHPVLASVIEVADGK